MNKKICVLLIPVVALAGCAPQVLIFPEGCPGNSTKTNNIAIVPSGNAKVRAVPEHVCVAEGSVITLVIPDGDDVGTIRSEPKDKDDPEQTWLNGTNNPNPKRIELQVPNPANLEMRYEYEIHWQGKDPLDPRVTVRSDDRT